MQGSTQLKRAILENLLLGLRKRGVASSRDMSLHERKNAVRHAADAALATARGPAPRWSRSLAAADELSHGQLGAECGSGSSKKKKTMPSESILRRKIGTRSGNLRARPKSKATSKAAGYLATKAAVRRRTRELREVVPGGKGMVDDCTLLGETLDYAVSLKAQVDAMQLLVRALMIPAPTTPNDNPASCCCPRRVEASSAMRGGNNN